MSPSVALLTREKLEIARQINEMVVAVSPFGREFLRALSN
jgi:hypothetical protein